MFGNYYPPKPREKFRNYMSLESLIEFIKSRDPIEIEFFKTLPYRHNHEFNGKLQTIYADDLTPLGAEYYNYRWQGSIAQMYEEYRGVGVMPIFQDDLYAGFQLCLCHPSEDQLIPFDKFKSLFDAIKANDVFAAQILELILDDSAYFTEELVFPPNLINLRFLSMNHMTKFSRCEEGQRTGEHPVRSCPPDLTVLPALKIFSMTGTWFTQWPNFKNTKLQHIIQGDCGQEYPPILPSSLIGYYTDHIIGCGGRMKDFGNFDAIIPDFSLKALPNLRRIFFSAHALNSHPILGRKLDLTMASKICLARNTQRGNFLFSFNYKDQTTGSPYAFEPDLDEPQPSIEHIQKTMLTKEILDQHFDKLVLVLKKEAQRDPNRLTRDRMSDLIFAYMDLVVSHQLPENLALLVVAGLLPRSRVENIMLNAIALQNMFNDTDGQDDKDKLSKYITQYLPIIINNATKYHVELAPFEYFKRIIAGRAVKIAMSNAMARRNQLQEPRKMLKAQICALAIGL